MKRFSRQGPFTWVILSVFAGFLFFLLAAGRGSAAPSVFDWEENSWPRPPISLGKTYSGIGSPATVFTYTFSGNTNRFEAYHSPETRDDLVTGGLVPVEPSLFIAANFITRTESITLTIDLSIESANVYFTIFDIDAPIESTGIDMVAVSGADKQGVAVPPTLIAADPTCVSISGNTATGLADAANDGDCGNLTVQFGDVIQKIIIVFGEASVASDPGGHGIGLHDLYFNPGGLPTPFPTPTPTLPPESHLNLPVILKP